MLLVLSLIFVNETNSIKSFFFLCGDSDVSCGVSTQTNYSFTGRRVHFAEAK